MSFKRYFLGHFVDNSDIFTIILYLFYKEQEEKILIVLSAGSVSKPSPQLLSQLGVEICYGFAGDVYSANSQPVSIRQQQGENGKTLAVVPPVDNIL